LKEVLETYRVSLMNSLDQVSVFIAGIREQQGSHVRNLMGTVIGVSSYLETFIEQMTELAKAEKSYQEGF
jgi:hypothetical protein